MTHETYMHHDPARATNGLVAAGYVTGVLVPIVGFFVGLALVIKNRAGHGVAVMVLSVVVVLVAASLIASGGGDEVTVAPVAEPTEWCNPWNDVADDC